MINFTCQNDAVYVNPIHVCTVQKCIGGGTLIGFIGGGTVTVDQSTDEVIRAIGPQMPSMDPASYLEKTMAAVRGMMPR